MHTSTRTTPRRVALASLLALGAGGASGCTDFLTSGDAGRNPNQATTASRNQLFVAVQAGQFGVQEASLAMAACLWTQQCGGVGGRFVEQYGQYNFTEGSFSADFTQTYAGGGLVDLLAVRRSAEAAGDRTYEGIAKVWEALVVGTAASVWGDIPYSQIANPSEFPTPALDPQLEIYAELQALLDDAIADLASGEGAGPGINDLVHRGDAAKWIEAAHTLKARYHLHTVEVLGDAAYEAAVDAALGGISAPANDVRALHGGPTSENNMWYQFQTTSFGADLVAGKTLVDLMIARGDPRLDDYFGEAPGGGYGGALPTGAQSANGASPLAGAPRNDPLFRQPLVTYQENELILAEAYNRTGQDALALEHLNNARAVVPLPPLDGLSGDALFGAIMQEKYVALFQNVEVWNDYKRTCLPGVPIVPFAGATAVTPGEVPGRAFYGQFERNANPNVPSIADQLAHGGVAGGRPGVGGFRNPNDPAPCT